MYYVYRILGVNVFGEFSVVKSDVNITIID